MSPANTAHAATPHPAIAYVHTLFKPEDWFCNTCIRQTDKRVKQDFLYARDFNAGAIEKLETAQSEGYNIYTSMNAFTSNLESRAGEDVKDIRDLYVDHDGPKNPGDLTVAQGLGKIEADVAAGIIPQPQFTIASSESKRYSIWRVSGFTPTQAEEMNRALCQRYGGDSASVDVSRVLRLPGFINLKYESKPVVHIVKQTKDSPYTIDKFRVEFDVKVRVVHPADPVAQQSHAGYYQKACEIAGVYEGDYSDGRRDGAYCWDVPCPNKDAHETEGESGCNVLIYPSGRYHYGCFHNHCSNFHWPEYRAYLQSEAAENGHRFKLTFGDVPENEPASEPEPTEQGPAQPAKQKTRQDIKQDVTGLVTVDGDLFMSENIPPRKVLLRTVSNGESVFFRPSINQIFAWRGIGKTNLGLGLVRAMSRGERFLNWEALEPSKILYVEGELPGAQMQERWKQIVGPTDGNAKLITLDKQVGNTIPGLATPRGMEKIENTLQQLEAEGFKVEVLFLDSISTLFKAKNNDEDSWIVIQDWLINLRSRGICIFFFHHAGKSGLSRSHSKSEDMLDVSIKLEAPKEAESGCLHAIMSYDKARSGLSEGPAEIKMHRAHSETCKCKSEHVIGCPGDSVRWTFESLTNANHAMAEEMFAGGASAREVAKALDVPLGTIFTWRTKWAAAQSAGVN